MNKLKKRNYKGETPLHQAAIKVGQYLHHCHFTLLSSFIVIQGNVAMVRKLLRMGADPNAQDNAGRTLIT